MAVIQQLSKEAKDMNILILSGSPRKGGNTDLLVEAFVKGASQKHHVEIVSVHDYKVNPCMGCNACFKSENNTCVQKDDMALIYETANEADMLVIIHKYPKYQQSKDVQRMGYKEFERKSITADLEFVYMEKSI